MVEFLNWLYRMNLRHITLSIIIAVALVAVYAITSYENALKKAVAQFNERNLEHAGTIATSIRAILSERESDIEFLKGNNSVINLLEAMERKDTRAIVSSKKALANEFSGFLQRHKNYVQIRHIDEFGNEVVGADISANGTTIISEPKLVGKGSESYFRETMKISDDEVFVTELEIDRELRQTEPSWLLQVATPIFFQGERKGIILLHAVPNEVSQIVSHTPPREFRDATNHYCSLVTSSGKVLLPPSFESIQETGLDETLINDILVGNEGAGLSLNSETNSKELVAYSPIHFFNLHWSISSHARYAGVTKTVRESFGETFLLSLVLIGLIIGTGAYIRRVEKRELMLREEKKYMTQVKKSEQRYRSIFENANDSIVVTDGNGMIVFFNPAAEKSTGYEASEVIGKDLSMFYLDDNVSNEILRFITEEKDIKDTENLVTESKGVTRILDHDTESNSIKYEALIRHKNGNTLVFQISRTPLKDEKGNIVGFVGLGRDVTEQRKLESNIELFYQAFLHSTDEIALTDKEGRIIAVNKAFARRTGYSEEEILGKTHSLLKSDSSSDELFREMWRDILDEKKGFWSGEVVNKRKSGELYPILLTITPIRNENGEITNYMGIGVDITERKRLEDELSQTQKMAAVGELAAAIAHEVRNPLAGISGAIQVIGEDFEGSDPRREITDEIVRQIKRLNNIVQDLLTFARPSEPRFAEADICLIVDNALDVLRHQPLMEGIEVVKNYNSGMSKMIIDAELMEHVITNIILNSLEAMSRAGTLTISSEDDTDFMNLKISDTGSGISKEALDKIFDPFFSTKHRGTGLGLSISRKIIKAHGGKIRVASTAGQGTTFTITLPKSRNGME